MNIVERNDKTAMLTTSTSLGTSPNQPSVAKSKLTMLDVYVSLLRLSEGNERGRDHLKDALQAEKDAVNFARYVSSGKDLLRFSLTTVFAENDISDIEFAFFLGPVFIACLFLACACDVFMMSPKRKAD